ncbi:hypothetical protein [Streptococcus thoraltensis]|uniref:hypothetical protein n=1 Tax=Streptococcus thoraltensis TaxID=55085 RepID=UPI001F5A52B6|nr:hypothetical protein [Streptococcus thoraltensis]
MHCLRGFIAVSLLRVGRNYEGIESVYSFLKTANPFLAAIIFIGLPTIFFESV